jgi:acyl-CoA reductase-like NAD-dependent aldehyde dehydrogenase
VVAAGCTVVIKPGELSALQTLVLLEAIHKAGLPKGLLNPVTGGPVVLLRDLYSSFFDVRKIFRCR